MVDYAKNYAKMVSRFMVGGNLEYAPGTGLYSRRHQDKLDEYTAEAAYHYISEKKGWDVLRAFLLYSANRESNICPDDILRQCLPPAPAVKPNTKILDLSEEKPRLLVLRRPLYREALNEVYDKLDACKEMPPEALFTICQSLGYVSGRRFNPNWSEGGLTALQGYWRTITIDAQKMLNIVKVCSERYENIESTLYEHVKKVFELDLGTLVDPLADIITPERYVFLANKAELPNLHELNLNGDHKTNIRNILEHAKYCSLEENGINYVKEVCLAAKKYFHHLNSSPGDKAKQELGKML